LNLQIIPKLLYNLGDLKFPSTVWSGDRVLTDVTIVPPSPPLNGTQWCAASAVFSWKNESKLK